MTSVQKFYLRNVTASPTPTTGEKSSVEPVATSQADVATGAEETRSLLGTAGVAQTSIAQTTDATTSARNGYHARFSSQPLAAGTYGSGTITIAVAVNEGNNASNAFHCLSIYFWRPSNNTVVGFVYDSDTAINATEWAASESGKVNNISGANVTIQNGDILVMEFWRKQSQANGTARTNTLYFEGTTDPVDGSASSNASSYLNMPAAIPLFTANVPKTTTADIIIKDTDVTKTLTTDLIVALIGQKTTTTDVIIKDTDVEKTTKADLITKSLDVVKTTSADILTRLQGQKTLDSDIIIKDLDIEKTTTSDIIIKAKDTQKTTEADVIIKALDTQKTTTTDVITKSLDTQKTTTSDLLTKALDQIKTFTADLITEAAAGGTKTFTADLIVVAGEVPPQPAPSAPLGGGMPARRRRKYVIKTIWKIVYKKKKRLLIVKTYVLEGKIKTKVVKKDELTGNVNYDIIKSGKIENEHKPNKPRISW